MSAIKLGDVVLHVYGPQYYFQLGWYILVTSQCDIDQ